MGRDLHWFCRSDEDQKLLEPLVPYGEPPSGARVVKQSRTRKVLRATLADNRAVYIKRYKIGSIPRRIASLVHTSKARREFQVNMEAERRQVPVARVLGGVEVEKNLTIRENYLIHEAVEPACDLKEYCQRFEKVSESEPLAELRRSLVRFLVEVQGKGFKHDDFRADHILVCDGDDSESGLQFVLIDLDNAAFRNGPLGYDDIVHNLVQLNRSLWGKWPSLWERLKFLREFIRVHPRLCNQSTLELWTRIAVLSVQRRRKDPWPIQVLDSARFEMTGKMPPHFRKDMRKA